MATPLTWNAPGLTWNQPGATWNGVAARPPHMSKTKAIVDFSGYAAGDLAPVAQNIHDEMTAHAATFGTPPVTMIALQALIDDFNEKLAAKESRATADIIAFNVARHELEEALFELGNHVNNVAKGDHLLTLEAMKVFMHVNSPRDAIVKELMVGPKDAVEGGDLLVVFE